MKGTCVKEWFFLERTIYFKATANILDLLIGTLWLKKYKPGQTNRREIY